MAHHVVRTVTLVLATSAACASDPSGDAPPGSETGGSADDDGSGDGDDGGSADESGDETGHPPVVTDLPPLPELPGVKVRITGDAANVTFPLLDAGADYRIYPLPADEALTIGDDGSVVVADAIYRCAGHREALYMLEDIVNGEDGWNDNSAGGATILNHEVEGFLRNEADATLGHVYPVAGEGLVPVYELGDNDPGSVGGFGCGRPIFDSTRPKVYTTDEAMRDSLVAERWRDMGIAFYVPAAGGDGTHPVYEAAFGDNNRLRWIDGPEGTARGAGTTLFEVLDEPAEGTVPLMRIQVLPYCTRPHDALVAGTARFAKVRNEGDHPMPALRWSGLTEDTVLVVEALDSGCPYQGNLSTAHLDAFTETFGESVMEYEAYSTIDDMRSAAPTGEVFINGQYDTDVMPNAIARTFVHAEPDLPQMDFYNTFPATEDLRATFGEPTGNEYGLHFDAPDYGFSSYNNSNIFYGTMLGEFWATYNDIAADVNGKIRLTPKQKAEISADTFLHVTTEVDVISTGRRYPQIIISDQDIPVQDNLVNGVTVIVQPKDYTPTYLQVQVCDHRTWDVNDQCPVLSTFTPELAPVASLPGEMAGTDQSLKIDVWLSTNRIYLAVNDEPYSCTDFPATSPENGMVYTPPSGDVTVTWGDVLYHSGVDFETGGGPIMGDSYLFHRTHMQKTARRHFDNIGFSSGAAAPEWDEALIPCVGVGG